MLKGIINFIYRNISKIPKFLMSIFLIFTLFLLIYGVYQRSVLVIIGVIVLILYFAISKYFISNNSKKNNFNRRKNLSIIIVSGVMLLIFYKLLQIQLFQKNKFERLMNEQIVSKFNEVGERGIIYDSNGRKLAFNKREYNLVVDPSLLNDENLTDDILKDISLIKDRKILKFKENIIEELKDLSNKKVRYKIIAKNIDDETKKNIEELWQEYREKNTEKFKGGKYKSSLSFEKNIERIYYKKSDYEKLIGMVRYTDDSSSNKIGISGLEKQYEKYLVEKKRSISKLYGLNKKNILPLSKDVIYSDLNGKNLHLTIDTNINYILNEEIKKQFLETNSFEAYGVVMDPNTGKILGVSSFSNDKKLLRNNLFQSQYEPGSIFKPLIVAAALNENLINKNSKFDVGDGVVVRYGHKIRESSRTTRGILTTKDVLKKSSNVGMVLISDYFSDELFEEYLKKYGLYEKTEVDFPDEVKPYTISYKKWDRLKKNNMAFGQGVVVTPIQMITAFSSVINGGKLFRPYIVDKITDNNGIVIMRNTPQKIRDVVDEDVSKTIREILEETVNSGTGKRAYTEGYRIGGKTGTAQLSAGKAGYEKQQYLSSFIGFFPADKPKYIVMAMFMRPQSANMYEKFGGFVAAPVVGNIARRIMKQDEIFSKNISKLKPQKIEHDKKKNNFQDIYVMPDLYGISPREVLEIFEDTNIEIEVIGTGTVVEQYPKNGESLENIKKIKIILK